MLIRHGNEHGPRGEPPKERRRTSTPLNGAVIDWLRLFARPHFLAGFEDKEAEEIMQAVQDICAVDCRDSQGRWSMVYIRLRVVAVARA